MRNAIFSLLLAAPLAACTISLKPQGQVLESRLAERTIMGYDTPSSLNFFSHDVHVHLASADTFSIRVVGDERDLSSLSLVPRGRGRIDVRREEYCMNGNDRPLELYVTSPKYNRVTLHVSDATLDNSMPIETDFFDLDCRHLLRPKHSLTKVCPQVSLTGLRCDSLRVLCTSADVVSIDSLAVASVARVELRDSARLSLVGRADSLVAESAPASCLDVSRFIVINHE